MKSTKNHGRSPEAGFAWEAGLGTDGIRTSIPHLVGREMNETGREAPARAIDGFRGFLTYGFSEPFRLPVKEGIWENVPRPRRNSSGKITITLKLV